ncbi:MAG: glycosyltransferase family 2 protein [Acidimicrobiia bacterium]|nr:glycosyltransferase family 2 protein [Acidimicrobiia bacterium]
MSPPRPGMSLAVAIPAYNEADGIAAFLAELDAVLVDEVAEHTFVVVDDASTDTTVVTLEATRPSLVGELEILAQEENHGHGPSVVVAYRRTIELGTDLVLQVDGDGQFDATDVSLLLDAIDQGRDVATGRRVARVDPLIRRMVTAALNTLMRVGFGVVRSDTNCPLRLYRSAVLDDLLSQLPPAPMVPHVLLTVLETDAHLDHVEVAVTHRDRRGSTSTGSTWQGRFGALSMPWRLARFCGGALMEVVRFRRARRT